MYRYRTSAINVETAVRASVTRLDVRSDDATRRMMTAIANQKTTVKVAKYGVSEDKIPQTAGTFLDRGILFASRGEYEKAIADFTEAIRLNPNMGAAYELRARALRASISKVIGVRDNFTGIDTISTEGRASLNKMEIFDQVIMDYSQAIRLEPNNNKLYNERGTTYSDMGDIDWAIADFNQAIKMAPNDYDSYNNRGSVYVIKRDYNSAIEDFNHAIKINPNSVDIYRNRGLAYYYKEEWDWAIADFSRAIRISPNNYMAYNNRGATYMKKGDWNRAIEDFSQVIKFVSNAPEAYNNRGLAYYNKGDFDRAIADWETALRINPNDAGARRAIEMAKRNRGY